MSYLERLNKDMEEIEERMDEIEDITCDEYIYLEEELQDLCNEYDSFIYG